MRLLRLRGLHTGRDGWRGVDRVDVGVGFLFLHVVLGEASVSDVVMMGSLAGSGDEGLLFVERAFHMRSVLCCASR